MNSQHRISLAYSPDTDDAFMVHAIKERLIDTRGYEFDLHSADIQELNQAASSEKYDITAISVGAYPNMADKYAMLPIGASIGDRFGPAVIVAPGSPYTVPKDLANKRIAIPGINTSSFLAARILIGDFQAVPTYFKDIAGLVLSGEVDAGILIHELQMAPEAAGLHKLFDLGIEWTARTSLPLPLGANAIRRALGQRHIAAITDIYRQSILWGLAHRRETLASALRHSGAAIDQCQGERYISMYVNDNSLDLAPMVQTAIRSLLDQAGDLGLCPKLAWDSDITEAVSSLTPYPLGVELS